jgi:hypothetical protein
MPVEDESAYGGVKQLAGLLPDAKFVAFPGRNHFDRLTARGEILPEILHFLGKAG